MSLQIRAERVEDYPAIAGVHVRAFEIRAAEALIVALHRQTPSFDPELSLVAELDGQVVGHVLFSPHTVHLNGQKVRAVNLAPIGIDPSQQRQGIGGRLIEEGHRIAREKGFSFSFLLGHPNYYPRFGYLTQAYGASSLTLEISEPGTQPLVSRSVGSEDVQALLELWEKTEGPVDFALEPGRELLDWLSPNPEIAVAVYTDENGRVAGYTRIHRKTIAKPAIFLAKDAGFARLMANQIAREAQTSEVILPLHPSTPLATELGAAKSAAWNAAMVCPLLPGPFEEYYAEVSEGKRPPGRPIWPTVLDFD